jgi:hypothetical protein
MHQNYHFIFMPIQMLLHISAPSSGNSHDPHKLLVGVQYGNNNVISSEVASISNFALGYKWIWLNVAGSGGLLWSTDCNKL